MLEINLEIESLKSIHHENFKLQSLLDEIQLKKRCKIDKNTLIFFDEIQESPRLLKLLRYFYEEAPHLKIMAAGSLLEIALKSENFSFPVGRVEFYHLGPLSFREFLLATSREFLDEKLLNFDFSEEVHQEGINALREYFYVGGMPQAVKEFSESHGLIEMRRIQSQIIQTYQMDFPKYNRRINLDRISRLFSSMALHIGKKVIYSKIDAESSSRDTKRVLEILMDARVLLPCIHSSGNNSPLAGESDPAILKTYFIDIGLLGAMLNLDLETIDYEFKNLFNLRGCLAEQFVAQHLFFANSEYSLPTLFYHLRDKGTQKAEIDFLFEKKSKIYPMEIKSSAKGHLKSLKYFCDSKKSPAGIKISLAPYSVEEMAFGASPLINIPLYAIEYWISRQ
ncbi:MAG: ATP-binding protein [Oligoflexia bacterium]|nr:ATP-binding protein [Oligoflexia bacterium]